jgi:hypothetical protein
MLAHLHLSNGLISGMIELDIYLPVRLIGPPKTGMRKFTPPAIFYDPQGLLVQESLPPWKGWWKSSGNKVYGETKHTETELIVEWHKGERACLEINKKTRLRVGRRLTFTEMPTLYEIPQKGKMLGQVELEIVKLVVL